MLKFVFMATILLMPVASAGFISSEMNMEIESPSPIPYNEAVTLHAKINFSWGFGAIIPMPLVIYLSPENVPDWLSVSIQPSSFTITPLGWRGGSIEKDFTISMRATAEAPAYVTYTLGIRAFTNGSLIINGAETREAINVMQDFHDGGIIVEGGELKLALKESGDMKINVTNNSNSPVYIEFYTLNESKSFDIAFPLKQLIPSHSTKVVSVGVTANRIGKEEVMLKIAYYPPNHQEKTNYAYTTITLKSYENKNTVQAISIGIIIVIIISIIAVIWKKKG